MYACAEYFFTVYGNTRRSPRSAASECGSFRARVEKSIIRYSHKKTIFGSGSEAAAIFCSRSTKTFGFASCVIALDPTRAAAFQQSPKVRFRAVVVIIAKYYFRPLCSAI